MTEPVKERMMVGHKSVLPILHLSKINSMEKARNHFMEISLPYAFQEKNSQQDTIRLGCRSVRVLVNSDGLSGIVSLKISELGMRLRLQA